MFYSAESMSHSELSRVAAERYAHLAAVREHRARAKKKVPTRVRTEVVKAA